MNVDVILCIMIICLAGVVMVVPGFKVGNTTTVNVSENVAQITCCYHFCIKRLVLSRTKRASLCLMETKIQNALLTLMIGTAVFL